VLPRENTGRCRGERLVAGTFRIDTVHHLLTSARLAVDACDIDELLVGDDYYGYSVEAGQLANELYDAYTDIKFCSCVQCQRHTRPSSTIEK
jgi:hypothetical protein